jgi:hypothetical protein
MSETAEGKPRQSKKPGCLILLGIVVVGTVGVLVFGGGSKDKSSTDTAATTAVGKPKDCPTGVDKLHADLAGATSTSGVDAATVLQSFKLCDGPEEWKIYAKVDDLGGQIGSFSDMNGSPLSTDTALNFLCSRYDTSNSNDTCSQR